MQWELYEALRRPRDRDQENDQIQSRIVSCNSCEGDAHPQSAEPIQLSSKHKTK